jgi:hypothetical protein
MSSNPPVKKILFLSANPRGTVRLRLDEEMREIKEGLRRAKRREQFTIESAEAVRYRDIRRAVLDFEPNVVHFSGHGEGEKGLVFEDEVGQVQFVSAEALAGLFELLASQVECVILNACYAQVQAEAIARHIPYVIGMKKGIGDPAAIEFAVGFYDALGAGKSVEDAYRFGCNAVQLPGIPEHLTPQLLTPRERLQVGAGWYIDRPPIEAQCARELLKEGALVRLRAPEKMGKTVLIGQIFEYLKTKGYRTARVSLKELDKEDITHLETLLYCFCQEVSRELNLPSQAKEYWEEDRGNKPKCTSYFEDYLLPAENSPLVLAIDDVDWLFPHPSVCEDFCLMLRSWYERAKTRQIWQQLRLIFVYSTKESINLPEHHSPFNVGVPIELPEFTIEQVQAFAKHCGLKENAIQVPQLIDLVGGHPSLVKLAFSYLKAHPDVTLEQFLTVAPTEQGIYSSHLRQLLGTLQQNPDLRAAFKAVVTASKPVRLETLIGHKLRSMGLIKWQENQALPSCQLYRRYFSDRL